MTVDRIKKQGCDWCGKTTNQYEGVHSEVTEELYCSEGCKDKAVNEKRADCDHFTAVDVRIVEGKEYGVCEECRIEVVMEDEIWKPV